MEYGKLQGEIVAAGHVVSVSGAASLVGVPFNTRAVSFVSAGLYAVTLGDGVDQLNCANLATSDTTPATVTANNSGLDTDTVKRFTVVDAAGALLSTGFYYTIIRTNVS